MLYETTSLCPTCKQGIPASAVVRDDNSVWLEKACAEHGVQDIQISNDADWFQKTLHFEPTKNPPEKNLKPVDAGCPFDCGPCEQHEQKVRLPVVTVTSACNIDCPICYVHNKNDAPFHMTTENFAQILEHLIDEHGEALDIINLTGGEPTLHPQIEQLVQMAVDAGVHRTTICSNGIALLKNPALTDTLARLGARIALSFDTLDDDTDHKMNGIRSVDMKNRVLKLLAEKNIDTTLIPVVTRGYNDHEIGEILTMALSYDNIRHVEVHTMTYTGQGGASFDRSGRITMAEVLERVETQTDGWLKKSDFVPSPCAHPLCYQIAYLLKDESGGPAVPFTRFVSPEVLYACLSDRLYLEPSEKLEAAMREAIDRLWLNDDDESARALKVIKRLLDALFPSDRQVTAAEALAAGEQMCQAVYIHSHMDEETWDNSRIVQCCDSNCYADGRTVPVCSYNVLYRETEAHFMLEPKRWGKKRGGQRHGRGLPVVNAS